MFISYVYVWSSFNMFFFFFLPSFQLNLSYVDFAGLFIVVILFVGEIFKN